MEIYNTIPGTAVVVQWSRLCTSTLWGMGSIPGSETKIPSAVRHSQNFFLRILFLPQLSPFHALSSFYPSIV